MIVTSLIAVTLGPHAIARRIALAAGSDLLCRAADFDFDCDGASRDPLGTA